MKSKLKVKRIVDSFLSKDDVGFYKIEWEESWLPVDAFHHLKYLIEEFLEHKKAFEKNSIQKNDSQTNTDKEKICTEEEIAGNLIEKNLHTCETSSREDNTDGSKQSIVKNESAQDIATDIDDSSTHATSTDVKCDEEIDNKEQVIEETTCYFCGGCVNIDDLNRHEHEHIGGNCSDVLINLIGECQNGKVVFVHIDQQLSTLGEDASSSNKDDSSSNKGEFSSNEVSSSSVSTPNKEVPSPYTKSKKVRSHVSSVSASDLMPPSSTNASPTMTIHHRSAGLSCPVCNESFNLFNDFLVHFQGHRVNPGYYFCEECGKQFISKELFEKHTQLHIDAKRRQKSYGNKISSVKPGRKAIRRFIYPRMYPSLASSDSLYASKELIDLSESPFGSTSHSREYLSLRSEQSYLETNKMFVEMLETNRYRKRTRKEDAEFSPDVLRSARQYIKAVSKRRKVIKRSRLKAQEERKDISPLVHTLVDGIGVDVELERSENSLPNISFIDGKKAYGCKICSKTFFNKFHHREHYNVHSGEMPYECEFCLKRFAQRSGWNRHIKLHHKYEVFAGPIPRCTTEKHEKNTSYTSDSSPTLIGPSPSFVGPHTTIVGPHTTLVGSHTTIVGPHTTIVGPHTTIVGQDARSVVTSAICPSPALVVPSPASLGSLPSLIGPRPALVGTHTVVLGSRPTVVGPNPTVMVPHPSIIGPHPTVVLPSPTVIGPDQTVVAPSPNVVRPSSPCSTIVGSSQILQIPSATTAGLRPLLVPSCVSVPRKMEYNFHVYKPTEVQPQDTATNEIPPTTSTSSFSAISQINRVSFESLPPTQVLPPYQYRFEQLPDDVGRPLKVGVTPPSFSEASITQHALMSQQAIITESSSSSPLPETSIAAKKGHKSGEKTTAFQCKKVRTMNGDLIFMIRVSEKTSSQAPNKEFAYILDDAGFVESRIFVDDYPGGDWLDFPLDETANDVLRNRVHDYDEQNRRGPKPAHLAVNRKQLSKVDTEKDSIVSEAGKGLVKLPRAKSSLVSTKDIIASSLIHTTTVAGESSTKVPKSTHGRSFRSGREKKFSCNICERKFLAQAHLNDHMLIHTGELPYKCMFCNRPFRHKSGLNSHHKRHIQRGVFNRPISSKDKVLSSSDKPNIADVVTSSSQVSTSKEFVLPQVSSGGSPVQYSNYVSPLSSAPYELSPPVFSDAEIKSTLENKMNLPIKEPPEKTRRKGRKPKQIRKSPVATYFNGEEFLAKQGRLLGELGRVFSNVNKETKDGDVFECNFCTQKFPMRTAYLKHVNSVHRAPPRNTDNMDTEELHDFSDENVFTHEFPETLIKEEPFDDPLEMGDRLLNKGVVENLFPDVTIKEEEIDDAYLE